MKTILLSALAALFLFHPTASIYDFKIISVEGDKEIKLSDYKGKKILIVNTACKSPYTYQLSGLQQLYSAYREKLVVIAFPAGDDFGDQELKSNLQIRDCCRHSYGVSFPITEKTTVVGSARHPVFQYLIDEAKKLGADDPVIQWNFTKFLLDEKGQLIKVFPADVQPLSDNITAFLNSENSWMH